MGNTWGSEAEGGIDGVTGARGVDAGEAWELPAGEFVAKAVEDVGLFFGEHGDGSALEVAAALAGRA